MAGRDRRRHLPRPRLVAPREHSSPSPRPSSSSGRRVYVLGDLTVHSDRSGNMWMTSSSSGSSTPPSTHPSHSSTENPSSHEWDSPAWRRKRLPRSRFASSSSSASTWISTLSSDSSAPGYLSASSRGYLSSSSGAGSSSTDTSSRKAAAAAASIALRFLELSRLQQLAVKGPLPPFNSPEDWERRRQHGLEFAEKGVAQAPDPYWCDSSYQSSQYCRSRESSRWTNSSSSTSSWTPKGYKTKSSDKSYILSSDSSWSATPRFMKSSQDRSPPLLSTSSRRSKDSSNKGKKVKRWKRVLSRHLDFDDDDETDDGLY